MSIVDDARKDSRYLHRGIFRRDGEPFFLHCERVAMYARCFYDLKYGPIEEVSAISLMHDVIEDTAITHNDLMMKYSKTICDDVSHLTNVFTKVAYPDMNRADRKIAEHNRLADTSGRVRFIKMCDRYDNLKNCLVLSYKKMRLLFDESVDLFDKIDYKIVSPDFAEVIDIFMERMEKVLNEAI